MSLSQATPDVKNSSLEDRLYTIKYKEPEESHLGIEDREICRTECETDDCSMVCPADVWQISDDDGVPTIAYENCLECGSCRWGCPYDNVIWTYPEHGKGMTYKYG